MNKRRSASHPRRKGLRITISLLLYALSLIVVIPLIVVLSLIVPFSPLLLVLYSVAFFFVARRLINKRAAGDRAETGREAADDLRDTRREVRTGDRSKAIMFGLLWMICGISIAFALGTIGAGWLAAPLGLSDENDIQTLSWILTIVSVLVLLTAYSTFARHKLLSKRLDRTVLWLRRFHQDGMFPFDLVLDDVCRGVALPLTVADTTVPKSEAAGSLHPLLIGGGLMIGFAFMGGFAAQALLPIQHIALVAVPLGGAGIFLVWLGNRRGGRKDLRAESGRPAIDKLFHAIDHGLPVTSAMAVVRLSDENWQQWVGDFIERADAVIMDVTHLNENLGWELNACRERLAAGGMVLACCQPRDSETSPWLLLDPQLERYLGAEFLTGCQRFTYREPHQSFRWILKPAPSFRQRVAWWMRRKYEKPLLECVTAAFAAKDTHRRSSTKSSLSSPASVSRPAPDIAGGEVPST